MSCHGGRALVASLVVLVLLAAGTPRIEAVFRCSKVYADIAPCISYLREGGAIPPACCVGVRNLVTDARAKADRQAICVCLKTAGNGLSGVKLNLATTLPAKCRVVSPFKITPSIDCSKIN